MQFGLQINPYFNGPTGNPWDSVERVARAVDASAFDSLWVYDHFLYEGGYSGHPYSEPADGVLHHAGRDRRRSPSASGSGNWCSACPTATRR